MGGFTVNLKVLSQRVVGMYLRFLHAKLFVFFFFAFYINSTFPGNIIIRDVMITSRTELNQIPLPEKTITTI